MTTPSITPLITPVIAPSASYALPTPRPLHSPATQDLTMPQPHPRHTTGTLPWLVAAVFAATLALGVATSRPAHAQAPASPPAASAAVNATPATPVLTPTRDIAQIRPPAPSEFADNPYGLRALWRQGDWIAKVTLLILAVMSLGSWYVLVAKLIEQWRMGQQARAAQQVFASATTLRQGAGALHKESPFRFIVDSAMDVARKHDSVASEVDLNTWVTQGIEHAVGSVQSRAQDGLAVLATVGATAPFVGLFGTVWGIYNALVKIGVSGQASIDKVAGPVGEALIMTAIGLAVAVPAVLGYNWLVRRNRVAMDAVRNFGSDLHTRLLASVSKSRRAGGERAGADASEA